MVNSVNANAPAWMIEMNDYRDTGKTASRTRTKGAAFAALYQEHMPGVYRYILYRVGDVPTAEDLTSATFEKALNGFQRYASEKASFATWVMSIARNTLIDHYRARGRKKDLPLETAFDLPAKDPPPDEAAVRREELQQLRFCLAGLTLREQEIISFKFGAGSTNRSIAGVLELSESSVGVTVYRAIQKLKECFRKWQNGRG